MASLKVLALVFLCTTLLLCSLPPASGKSTTLTFYMHDNVSPPNVTAIPVAGAGGSRNTQSFGTVTIIDDALTETASPSSALIGRGQGTWIVCALDGSSLLLTFSAVFQTGLFNGSTLSLHGADKITAPTRELAIVGGTGEFRFARGFAVITTASFTPASVTLKVDVTANH